ncbi:MAG: type II toxin-antitoxin system VapC family toxin [Desulfobacteraceae bacterium]|nr:MAG: type II toxin-antitoxin system VapC family toxin [Desulfobacteraceae bacterium]
MSGSLNGAGQLDMILIDTDILIDVARNVNEAVNCLQQVDQQFSAVVSSVTQMELIIGCRDKNELRSLDHFLERFQIINVSEQISETAIDLLKQYRLSHGLQIADALIAATAIVTDIQLISKNQRDYRFIEALRLLPYPEAF